MNIDGSALLQRHNPILVLYPQESARERPGARRPGARGWGDYHPCSAEFFLDRVHQRDGPRPYDIRGLLGQSWRPLTRTSLARLRERLMSLGPDATRGWELDVADIPSQDERRAWAVYGDLLRESEHPYEPVVYGHFVEGPSGPALQYWYLYIYNDFRNNHEADWEMAAIELAADGDPVRIGLSCHHGGYQRTWADAQPEGARPIVYVARGSHAGYFAYREKGYDVLDLVRHTNLPSGLGFLKPLMEHLPSLRSWRDHPPADPLRDPRALERDRGVRLEPTLRPLPVDPSNAGPDFWWMRYQGKWGSMHTRIAGTVGVDSPWGPSRQPVRWTDPVAWIRSLRIDGQ